MNQEMLHVEELESRLEMEATGAAEEAAGSCEIKCTCTIEF